MKNKIVQKGKMGLKRAILRKFVDILKATLQSMSGNDFLMSTSLLLFFRLHFISNSNELEIAFHTDDTVRDLGYELSWNYKKVSHCPQDHLYNHTGILSSPGYPDHYDLPYECDTWISAPGLLFIFMCVSKINISSFS